MDDIDRAIVNALQDGFPLTHAPFAEVAARLGLSEQDLIARIARLRETRAVTRFGPFFNAKEMGGDFCLCAMSVPADIWDDTVARVNARPEVAHNYRRDHMLNMWFVLAVERADEIERIAAAIAQDAGLEVHLFPKLREYFLDMRVAA